MFIEKLCYKSEQGEQIGPVNLRSDLSLIFGRNGAGKTRTLNLLFNIGNIHKELKLRFIGDHQIVLNKDGKKYFYHLVTKESPIKIGKKIVEQDSLYSGEMGENLIFDRTKNLLLDEIDNSETSYSPAEDDLSLNYVKDIKKNKTMLELRDYLTQFKRLDYSMSNVLQQKHIPDALMVEPDGTMLDVAIINIMSKYPSYFSKIKDYFIEIFPQIEDIVIAPLTTVGNVAINTIFIKECGIDFTYPYFMAASGMVKVLAILSILLSPAEKSLILIDELENGLDYESIVKISEVLKQISTEVQIVITTHSPIVVSNFDLENWIIAKRDKIHSIFYDVVIDDKLKKLLNKNIEKYSLYSQDLLTLKEQK